MVPRIADRTEAPAQPKAGLTYIQEILGQLAIVARKEREDVLAYLIEMAFEEARDAAQRQR